jgi:cell division protein FtsA
MIGDEVRRSGYEGLLPAGVVLTGGVAAMPGLEPLASGKLRMPVRIGRPRSIGGLAEAFESPAYATSVGLVLWGMKQAMNPQTGTSRVSTGIAKIGEEQLGLLTKWLKRFLPQD